MPRKIKTAFDGAPDADRSLTGIHDIAFLARERDGVRGVEVRVGGGTSIMPRVAPTLYEFVGLDDGEYLKVAEACFRIFDRQDFLRVNRARARIKVLVDKVGIDALPRDGRRGARRATGSPSATSTSPACASTSTRRRSRPRAPADVRRRRTATCRRSSASSPTTSQPQRQHGFSTVHVKVTRGDLTPEQLRGIADDHAPLLRRLHAHDRAPELPAALGARRDGLRGLAGARRARPRRHRPGHDHRRRLVPRHGLLQARHHVLDGPQRRAPAAPRGDADHRSADARDPHQDERLPERLQPAPHREHRLLRRVDQGRRAHDPGVRRAHRRQLRGRRDRLRHAPEGAPAGQARPRRRRALAALVRGRARGRRGVQRLRRARRHEGVRGQGPRPRAARRVRPRDDEHVHRLEPATCPFQVVRGEGECAV